MKILSFDTAMAACSAAVVDTDSAAPLASAFVEMERGHAEALPPMVAEVMRRSGLDISAVERIAVTVGPGTFTGVRIGLAFARGLGLARGIPVMGVDSLSAIAANETTRVPLLVVSDARNDEVYAAIFNGDHRLIRGPYVTTAAAAALDVPSETVVIGTAAYAVIAGSGRDDLVLSCAGSLPDATRVARLAMHLPPGAMPSPLYLRAPDAKPQSAPLRKINRLNIAPAGPATAELLSMFHCEVFDEGWSPQAFAALLATPGTAAAVASDGDEPLGFIVSRRAADEAEILSIGSRPSVQRRGVARTLLEAHFKELAAVGVRQLFLEVAASNAPAQALYLACGFVEAGRRKGYYKRRDGVEDAIVMRRELHP